jgi:preprotein translocase subunit YajC
VDKYFPIILIGAAFVGVVLFSRRNRRRVAEADAARRDRIRAGSAVMTTSGLYGTVVSVNPDGTVLLSVARGVEVKWAMAALRDVSELPDQYRTADHAEHGTDEPGAPAG